MATRINAGENVRRGDLFFINPYEIIVSEELRGRHLPPTEDQIIEMACSLLDHGQLQPVNARRVKDQRLSLTAGFTRTAAARMIRDGFIDPDGNERKDEAFVLQVKIKDCNDREAFTANVIENARRNATSAMDDAHNQNKLRDYGMTDTEIGRLYGERSGARVSRLAKLLRLNDEAQLLVHQGALSVDAALVVLDLPDAEQKKVVEKAAAGEKVTGADVKRQVREHHLRDQHEAESTDGDEDGDSSSDGGSKKPQAMAPSGKTPKLPLSIKEVRQFFETLSTSDDSVEEAVWIPAVQKFAKDVQSWLAGKKSDKAMCRAIGKLLAGTPEKEGDSDGD